MKKFIVSLFLVFILSSLQVMAQGILTYGAAEVSSLSAQSPIAIYTFQGTEGDQVTVQAIGITPGIDLSITLQSGTEIIATADNDPFGVDGNDARLDVRLPSTNVYLILVVSNTGSVGDFLIKLAGQPLAEKTVITGLPADVPIVAGATSYYSFTGSPDGATTLNLNTLSPELQFLAVVRNSNGQIISTTSGASALINVSGVGPYEIALSGVAPSMEGIVTVTEGENGFEPAPEQPQGDPTAPPPVVTEEVIDATAPPPIVTEEVIDNNGVCVASADGPVNIRSGPTTNDAVLAQMQPGQSYPVTGVYVDWYQILISGANVGWVFSGVVNTSGNCTAIPPVAIDGGAPTEPPPPPPPTATAVPDTGNNPVQATATYTPSYTPTTAVQQATATYTPSYTPTTPPPQLAPEDARFNNPLNIQLDSTASVLDFVSYPGGDTEDRVRWDIIGMNQNASISGGQARLVISVSCFGEGTDQIQFFTGGQTYSCGQTIVDTEVTFNSKTGSVVITAVGGSNTYVQWVLTGTATRVN